MVETAYTGSVFIGPVDVTSLDIRPGEFPKGDSILEIALQGSLDNVFFRDFGTPFTMTESQTASFSVDRLAVPYVRLRVTWTSDAAEAAVLVGFAVTFLRTPLGPYAEVSEGTRARLAVALPVAANLPANLLSIPAPSSVPPPAPPASDQTPSSPDSGKPKAPNDADAVR